MKLWRHIVLVAITGAVPLFVVSLMLVKASYSEQIAFSLQEREGNDFQRPLEQLLVSLPRYQEAARQSVTGEAPVRFEFAAVRQQIDESVSLVASNYQGSLGKKLGFTDAELAFRKRDNARLAVLLAAWDSLKHAAPTAIAQGYEIPSMVASVRAMIDQASETSNLVLDNELDTYYLVDLTAGVLPQLQPQLAEMTFRIGNSLRVDRGVTGRSQAAVYAAMLQVDADRILRDAEISVAQNRTLYGQKDGLQKNLPPALARFNDSFKSLQQLLDRVVSGQPVAAAAFENAGWAAHAESFRLGQTGADQLDRLLAQRVQTIEAGRLRSYLIITFTGLAVVVVMGIIIRRMLVTHGREAGKATERLRAKETQLRVIGDNLPDGMVYEIMRDFDGTMRFVYVSAGVERLFGLTAESVLQDASRFLELISPEDREQLQEARRISLANKSAFNVTLRMKHKDGGIRWMHMSSMPRRLPDGRFVWDGIATDITQRKQAEAALHESEKRFRTLIEKAPTAISISRNGIRIYSNQKFQEMFGCDHPSELDGQPVGNQWAPESRAEIEEYARRRSQGLPAPPGYEAVALRKDGSRFAVHVAVTVVELPDGPASIGFVTDISDRKRNELQIQHLNRVYAVLSDINQAIVREKDPQQMLETACRIAVEKGRFRMSWIGLLDPASQILKPVAVAGEGTDYLNSFRINLHDANQIKGPAGRALTSGQHMICNCIETDPDYAPWRDEALRHGYKSSGGFPLKADGQVIGLFSLYAEEADFFNEQELALLDELAMDIGFALEFHGQEKRRHTAEAAVKQSEERFSRMFHNSPVPISLSRLADGVFLDANDSFFRMSGYTREEIIGHTALELQLYPDPEVRKRIIKHLHEHGFLHQHEQPFRTKSGKLRHHLLWFDLITVDKEKCVLVIALDVTEQKQAERQQKQLEEQLRQAQKLEALGTLAGGIAHDFNNILGAIISFTELARMDHPHDAELQENLGEVLKASQRATSLVRQILSFSRQQKHERTNLQLAPVIKEAMKLLRATLPATIEIEQDIHGAVPDVLANPTQIHQVIMNLCTNAAHAMRNTPGRLTLKLDLVRLENSDAQAHVELTPGDYVRLAVSDTGHGMDEATAKRIFEPFFTTKGPGEGTGLGLSVVHGIVKEHNGVITVDSSPGAGTTFTLYFPPGLAAPVAPEQADAIVPPGNGQRILFVDDEPALGEAAQRILYRLGYQPVIFNSSQSVWDAFQKNPHAYDVLISDLTMPGMTGMELARLVLSVRPDMPIILTSGYSGLLTRAKAQENGVGELLGKPFDYQSIAVAINKVLQRPVNVK